jgi:hypothetical protein
MKEFTFTDELECAESMYERSSGVKSVISVGKIERVGTVVYNVSTSVLHS